MSDNGKLDFEDHVESLVGAAFPTAWIVMLTLGALHLDVDHRIPHPGFLLTLLVFLAVAAVVTFIRKAVS